MGPIIRPLGTADFPAFDGLMAQLHGLHADARPDIFRPGVRPYAEEEFCAMVADSDTLTLAAEVKGRLAGLCVVTLRTPQNPVMQPEPFAHLEDLCVAPDCRGRGVGALLFRRAASWAKERGVRRLDLSVWSFNADALAFYGHVGMIPQRTMMELKL